MNYDIFKSLKEKADAKASLPELEKHPGWKFIIKALDANIAFLSDQLRQKKDFTNLEQMYALQDRIDDLEDQKNLPKSIVDSIEEEFEPEEDDIYES
jgi:hypothetical protein